MDVKKALKGMTYDQIQKFISDCQAHASTMDTRELVFEVRVSVQNMSTRSDDATNEEFVADFIYEILSDELSSTYSNVKVSSTKFLKFEN